MIAGGKICASCAETGSVFISSLESVPFRAQRHRAAVTATVCITSARQSKARRINYPPGGVFLLFTALC